MLSRSIFFCSVLTASAFAASRPIGIITASGHFTLDRSQVWGNATLFSGEKVETDAASSQATLRNGVTIQLASASSASVSEDRLMLWKGTGQVAAPESYEIEAGGLAIRSASGTGRLRVGWSPGGEIEVTALTGSARVAKAGTGVVLASIPAGRRMNFAMQAGAAGTVTRTGCLLYKDGHFLMQDQNTQEVVELLGQNLAANLGNRVTVTGTASNARPTLNIATSVLNATNLAAQQQGGCLSVAAALDAQTTVANPPGPNAPPTPGTPQPPLPRAGGGGMSTGAKVAIVGAVVGGGVGAALALSGKKNSTSQ
ncbi:MAG TPA: hypothetical protein VK687_12335 [Bryobacteraceae bacterium]|nr:hypothetical protein [Bryobacteraceae bacterium]